MVVVVTSLKLWTLYASAFKAIKCFIVMKDVFCMFEFLESVELFNVLLE